MTDYATDAATGMIKREPAQAAITATGYVGEQWDQGGSVATRFACVINLEAAKVAAANETYTFALVASNRADRSDGTVIGTIVTGASVAGLEKSAAGVGDQLVMNAITAKNGEVYRYVDLHLTVGGTAPSIAFNARFTKGHY